jgi:nickel/cobalt transporter (NicO) family protein
MLRFLQSCLLLFLILALPSVAALAQTNPPEPAVVAFDKKRLLVQPRNPDGTAIQTQFREDPVLWVREKQQAFYGSLSASLRAVKTAHSAMAALTLLSLSFAYGVFHAAGPGHGKAVISAWLLATENDFKRGVVVAFLSSLFQALTAIVLVSILLLVVASAGAVAKNLTGYLESASYAMISLVGLYLIATTRRLKSPVAVKAVSVGTISHAAFAENFSPLKTPDHHVHDANCGHVHAPEPGMLRGDWSLTRAFSMAFAIGLRPCTGAILVLILANALGLYWAGVLSTLAMGFGTFLTVSVIAGVTIFAKDRILRFAGKDSLMLSSIIVALRLLGGAVIFGFGLLLFLGSLGTTNGML